MIVEFRTSFINDIKKIKNKDLIYKVKSIALLLEEVANLEEVDNLRKLSGYKYSYRIKIEDYRIGLYFKQNKVTLVRCLKRKDIYKKFPQKKEV